MRKISNIARKKFLLANSVYILDTDNPAGSGWYAGPRGDKMAGWVVGVDVGGTFTDFSAGNTKTGEAHVHKRAPFSKGTSDEFDLAVAGQA